MDMLRLITPPTLLPVTVAAAKDYLRIDDSTTTIDEQVERMIRAAATVIENYCNISIMPQTWELREVSLDSQIALPRPPLTGVTSIKKSYYGTETTVETSVYGVNTTYSQVYKKSGQAWPTPADYYLIRYATGYASLSAVPAAISQAVLDLAAFKYENIDNQSIPTALYDQIDSYKVYNI
jgi:uncharacterized phiE125 gp8 family phage protein